MDHLTHCPRCGKRRVPVITLSGRTDLQCISCDDPAVSWSEGPFGPVEKPIVTLGLVSGQAQEDDAAQSVVDKTAA
jgi:hypothetical protein